MSAKSKRSLAETSKQDAWSPGGSESERGSTPGGSDEAAQAKPTVGPPTEPVTEDTVKLIAVSVPSRVQRKFAQSFGASAPITTGSNSISVPTDASTSFDALGVRPWLVQSLESMAIRRPTGIQKGCIPEILKGRDCIGGSRTGSGKTVAFAAPILQKWADDPMATFALVLTPTRLVQQV